MSAPLSSQFSGDTSHYFLLPSSQPLALKERLWRQLLHETRFDPNLSLVDSFPVPVCRFACAYRCRLLKEDSAFGYDEMAKQTFYGLRAAPARIRSAGTLQVQKG